MKIFDKLFKTKYNGLEEVQVLRAKAKVARHEAARYSDLSRAYSNAAKVLEDRIVNERKQQWRMNQKSND